MRGELCPALELIQQLVSLAEQTCEPELLQYAHYGMGAVLHDLGDFPQSRTHVEHAMSFHDLQKRQMRGLDEPAVGCRAVAALTLWALGYPDQSLTRIREALNLAQQLSRPFSLSMALDAAAWFHQ